jgi:chromosome segregation ATPase
VPKLVDGEIHGAGLVMEPASKSTAFSHQVAERGVAMSADSRANNMAVYLQAGSMSQSTREEIRAEVLSRELQVGEIQDDAQAIADELDIPVGDVMEVLDPLLDMDDDEDEGQEMEDDNGEEAEDNEDDEEEDGEEMADGEMMDERIDELWEAIEDLKEEMASGAEMEEAREELSAAREELASEEEVRELREEKESLAGRVEELEGEPEKPKSLADDSGFEAEYEPSVGSSTDW